MSEMDDRRRGRPLLGVGVVVFRASDNALLLVRRAQPPAQGLWSVPGGLVERGERLVDACRREVLEETGIIVNLYPQPVKVLERLIASAGEMLEAGAPALDYHYLIVDFVGRVEGGNLRAGSDVAEAGWFDRSVIDRLPVTDGLAEVVERAFVVTRGGSPSTPLLG